jgi:hypothetical protein
MSSEPLYPTYLPTRTDGYIAPIAVPAFDADEPGLRADPAKASLLKGATVENITPRIGTEIRGVQISSLGKEGLDELALLAAERGVVVFVSALLSALLVLCKCVCIVADWRIHSETKILQMWGLRGRRRLLNIMGRCISILPWGIRRVLDQSSMLFTLMRSRELLTCKPFMVIYF